MPYGLCKTFFGIENDNPYSFQKWFNSIYKNIYKRGGYSLINPYDERVHYSIESESDCIEYFVDMKEFIDFLETSSIEQLFVTLWNSSLDIDFSMNFRIVNNFLVITTFLDGISSDKLNSLLKTLLDVFLFDSDFMGMVIDKYEIISDVNYLTGDPHYINFVFDKNNLIKNDIINKCTYNISQLKSPVSFLFKPYTIYVIKRDSKSFFMEEYYIRHMS